LADGGLYAGTAMSDKQNLGSGAAMVVGALQREERRRHPRFLYSASMTVRLKEGLSMPGISVDISSSGLSAMVRGDLTQGDTVQLDPVAGGRVMATVRHKVGRLYGFEFMDLSNEQSERIEENSRRFARPKHKAKSA